MTKKNTTSAAPKTTSKSKAAAAKAPTAAVDTPVAVIEAPTAAVPAPTASAKVDVRAELAKAFPFEITKLPLSGPDGQQTPFYTMFRSDNGLQIGGACKETFVPHTVDDVAVLTETAAAKFGGDVRLSTWWNGHGHEVIVAPRDTSFKGHVGDVKDIVWPRLHVRALYNGTAYMASLGLWRHSCDNLMMPKLVKGCSTKIYHSTNLRTRIDELNGEFQKLAGTWEASLATMNRMADVEVNMSEFIGKVFGVSVKPDGSQTTSGARRQEAILGRLTKDRTTLDRDVNSPRVTLWEAVNAVQSYVQHVVTRRAYSDSDLTERSFVALGDGRVDRTYEVAMSLLAHAS